MRGGGQSELYTHAGANLFRLASHRVIRSRSVGAFEWRAGMRRPLDWLLLVGDLFPS